MTLIDLDCFEAERSGNSDCAVCVATIFPSASRFCLKSNQTTRKPRSRISLSPDQTAFSGVIKPTHNRTSARFFRFRATVRLISDTGPNLLSLGKVGHKTALPTATQRPLLSITPPRDEATIAVRERVYVDAGRAAVFGLSVNVLLVAVKLFGGIITASSALIADAVNSVGDVASALAVRGALSVAQIAEDDDHPYGHTKAESIAGLCVALLVAFSATLLAAETLKRFGGDLSIPSMMAAWIAAGCAIAKEIAFRYTNRVANRLDSSALKATSLDHRSDAIGSGAVAVSLFAAPHLGWLGPYIDPIAALCVCVLLIVTGAKMFLAIAGELMDQQADDETVNEIRRIASDVSEVSLVEKLRVRKSGLECFVEIHVQVPGNLSVNEGHRIGHAVKDQLLATMPKIRDVLVHIEPDE